MPVEPENLDSKPFVRRPKPCQPLELQRLRTWVRNLTIWSKPNLGAWEQKRYPLMNLLLPSWSSYSFWRSSYLKLVPKAVTIPQNQVQKKSVNFERPALTTPMSIRFQFLLKKTKKWKNCWKKKLPKILKKKMLREQKKRCLSLRHLAISVDTTVKPRSFSSASPLRFTKLFTCGRVGEILRFFLDMEMSIFVETLLFLLFLVVLCYTCF